MNALGSTKSLLAVLTLATCIGAVTGCSAPVPEAEGGSSSKLLAPQAVFKGAATPETKKALGISEWRIYRGKTEYIVTGYNAAGKAVKGVGLAFAGKGRSSKPLLAARVLDGSKFSATHEYGGATRASTDLTSLSKTFVTAAVHDMTALRMGLKTSITKSAVRTGEACGGDMVKIVMSSLQCITQAKASGSSISKQVKVKQCVAAAQSASNAAVSCQNAGTTTTTPAPASTASSAKAPATTPPAKTDTSADKSSSGTSGDTQAAADKKQDAEQDKADDTQAAADKKQDTEQDKADAKLEDADKKQDAAQDKADDTQAAADKTQDAQQDAADAKADATTGADAADTASQDQTCTSCQGSAQDVQANDETGAVQASEAPAEAPAETPSEAPADNGGGGDTGGGDTIEV